VLQILANPSVLKQGSKGVAAEKAAVQIRSGVSNMLAPENQNNLR